MAAHVNGCQLSGLGGVQAGGQCGVCLIGASCNRAIGQWLWQTMDRCEGLACSA